MEMITLKNGEEEAKPLVIVTMIHLRSLLDEGKAVVIYELIELCRDPNHKLWGQTGEDLMKLGLVTRLNTSSVTGVQDSDDKFEVHDSIRNIVLSATTGEGLDMVISDPY